MKIGLGCVRPKGHRQAPVKVILVHWPKVGHLSPEVVPVPVQLIMQLVGVGIRKGHSTSRTREYRSHVPALYVSRLVLVSVAYNPDCSTLEASAVKLLDRVSKECYMRFSGIGGVIYISPF